MYGTSGVIEMPPPPASPAIQSSRSWARGPPEEPGPWSKLLDDWMAGLSIDAWSMTGWLDRLLIY